MEKLQDGTPLNVAVYKAYRNAGLSHSQALAITAEVGRENGFQSKYLFGTHIDPAANTKGGAIKNVGMLSWNQGRGNALASFLSKNGLLGNNGIQRSQAALNAQARFSVAEMKSPKYASKLKTFWNNPNANPEAFSRELGKHYVVWAYGQDTIRAKGGGRTAFDWRKHDNRRRNHLQSLLNMTGGGGGNFQAAEVDPRLAMSAPELLKTLRKDGKMNDSQLFVNLAHGNGRAAQEIRHLLKKGHDPADIAKQLGLNIKMAAPSPSEQAANPKPVAAELTAADLGLTPDEVEVLGLSDVLQAQQTPEESVNQEPISSAPLESSFVTYNQPQQIEPEIPQEQPSGKLQAITAELPKLKEQGLNPYQALYTLAQRDDDIGTSIRGAFNDGMNTEQMANYFGVNDIWQSQNEPSSNTLQIDEQREYQTPSLLQS